MNRFLIGMRDFFDEDKYRRDIKSGFYGVEAGTFRSIDEIKKLDIRLKRDNYNLCVHFPLLKRDYFYSHPMFLSKNRQERERAYDVFERDLELSEKYSAKYVLTHYPYPPVLDRELDWSSWRLKEYSYSDEYPSEIFEELSDMMFEKLSKMSRTYNVQIVIEHDILNGHFYTTGILKKLFEKYKILKACLDTGRIHQLSIIDRRFKPFEFIRDIAGFTHVIHLWNVKLDNNTSGGHYPVLKEQKACEGWADIGGFMKEIAKINDECLVMFEHRSELISDRQLEECYDWVAAML
ncbi:MAG: sugar phosphate isomerase/epimerase [Clostridia bacterium]|nr:sugar phosphate isomerase/epimerase [Clostridia bacterium]